MTASKRVGARSAVMLFRNSPPVRGLHIQKWVACVWGPGLISQVGRTADACHPIATEGSYPGIPSRSRCVDGASCRRRRASRRKE
jgi:hypothetical protein